MVVTSVDGESSSSSKKHSKNLEAFFEMYTPHGKTELYFYPFGNWFVASTLNSSISSKTTGDIMTSRINVLVVCSIYT